VPQYGVLFRVVAFFTHLQLGYLLRNGRHSRIAVRTFVFMEGLSALGIIAVAAYLAELPLLFPPLAPSAFILFRTPLSRAASPRAVFLSHSLGLALGLLVLHFFSLLFPEANLHGDDALNWPRIFALALTMGLVSLAMILLDCAHPPAAATALVAAMGYFDSLPQIAALPVAVLLLLAQALVFNRLLGGLPFPLWKFDPGAAKQYPDLAGLGDQQTPFWDRVTEEVFERRGR
jgi:CBS-domain-containing membrane protein